MAMHRELFVFLRLFILATSFFQTACAVHYYDKATNTEHLWGFGHLKMKSIEPNEGLQAVVYGTDVVGLSIGKAKQQNYFTLGWHQLQYIDILKEDTAIRLEWPDSIFLNVRIGSVPPVPDAVGNSNKLQ